MSNGQCVFVGRLVKDVEVRAVGNTNVANTSLAINDSYVDKNGDKQERTTYVDLEAWAFRATNMQDLKKGQLVLVLASPRMKSNGEGAKATLQFNIEEIGVIPRASQGGNTPAAKPKAAPKKITKTVEVTVPDDKTSAPDEIPF
jgi:single-strand DNA-binding protein